MTDSTELQEPWFLKYSFPVSFPSHHAFNLSIPQAEFDVMIKDIVNSAARRETKNDAAAASVAAEESLRDDTTVFSPASTSRDIRDTLDRLDFESESEAPAETTSTPQPDQHPFVRGLVSYDGPEEPVDMENKMSTENGDMALRSSKSSLVDLFFELERSVSGARLHDLLNAAWREDPLATLKIIYNSRSIHLGKGDRYTFYRCMGWLKQYHPLTFITNLRWLSRAIIEKKVEKKEDGEGGDAVMINLKPDESEIDENDVTRLDVKNGVSHGYWKDLTNILALYADGKLDVLADPSDTLNVDKRSKSTSRSRGRVGNQAKRVKLNADEAGVLRKDVQAKRHDRTVDKFNNDPIYRALYLTVARLFAEQLKSDVALLRDGDAKARTAISLCGKWTPSHRLFADKLTCVVSSIAEMLYPISDITAGSQDMDRELYLRHARERYRKDTSALRAYLDVVERELAAKTYDHIKYDRVPSIAMKNYSSIFAEKDTERFEEYLTKVAEGKMRISGATLFPSEMISKVRDKFDYEYLARKSKIAESKIADKMRELQAKTIDGQWKALVQRVKDSGTLASCIAVCDVSGSMCSPRFKDGTTPMDSSIGLSLLLAEVTAPPFGGHFITFSTNPQVETIDVSASLHDKVTKLSRAHWEMTTDFVAVFDRLILPMAMKNKLSPDDMVKRVFVFSDMQFDQASSGRMATSSLERIKQKFNDAGYEMPELIFWNLAGGRAGYLGGYGDPTAPKPAGAEEDNVSLVSGYSQSMLKLFLDDGSFAGEEESEDDVEVVEDDGDTVVLTEKTKPKKNPLTTVKKAIRHKAYDGLKVVD